ncbi:hypothetical protein B0H13DRAFT_2453184 [Mycena leptocephala]|nr:hypothetical protein B0H13DRAFT_2453184 [Mycena leptocephala]
MRTRNLCYPTAILHETLGKTWTHPKLVLVSIYCFLPLAQSHTPCCIHPRLPGIPPPPSPATASRVPFLHCPGPSTRRLTPHPRASPLTLSSNVARSARSPSPHRGPLPAPFQFSARAPSQEEAHSTGVAFHFVSWARTNVAFRFVGRALNAAALSPTPALVTERTQGVAEAQNTNAMGGGSGGPAHGGPPRFNGMGPQTMPSHRSEPHQQKCPNR